MCAGQLDPTYLIWWLIINTINCPQCLVIYSCTYCLINCRCSTYKPTQNIAVNLFPRAGNTVRFTDNLPINSIELRCYLHYEIEQMLKATRMGIWKIISKSY